MSKARIITEQAEEAIMADLPEPNPPEEAPAADLPEPTPQGPPVHDIIHVDEPVVQPEPVAEDDQHTVVKFNGETVRLTYRGSAAALSYGDFTLRPGVPVEVPKDVAEGLLTHPFEDFEVTEVAPPQPVEE